MGKKVQEISTGYTPRPIQADLHRRMKRFNVLVCHRRFGKTVFCINEMLDQALRCTKPNPRYAYLAPLFSQAKRVAWDYLKQYSLKIPGAVANEAELRIDIPRPALGDSIRLSLFGADNPDSLRGIYLDGAVLDEYGDMHPSAWAEVIRPTLSDRLGWAIFIGTPKGKNSFCDLYNRATSGIHKDWYGALYRASETNLISKDELESARLEMTEEQYEQEYECSFLAGITGSYYAKQIEAAERDGRVRELAYDPALPVDTFWDLGIGDSTSIWFVQNLRDMEYRVLEYVEDSGQGLEHFVKMVKDRPYIYGEHVLPHDAAARELGTGKTRQETLRELGLARTRILPRQSIEDGINAVRLILPKCFFDRVKTQRGRDCLGNYKKKWDEKNQIFSSKPLHDWASHGADAFRTFAMGVRPFRAEGYERSLPRQVETDYDLFG